MSLFELPITIDEAKEHTYKYWTPSKPIQQFENHSFGKKGSINEDFGKDTLYSSLTPISFEPFNWVQLKDDELYKAVNFINKYNYNNEKEKFFKKITPSYFKWSLGNNGVCHALKYKNTIVAVIGISFLKMNLCKEEKVCTNIKYMCLHPQYRTSNNPSEKTPFVNAIFDEIIRYHYTQGYRHGIFTTEVFVPIPFVSYREFFRPLNYEKLLNNKFFVLNGDKKSIQDRFNENTKPSEFYFEAIEDDLEYIFELYNEYCNKFNIYVNYSFEEFKFLLWNENVRLYVIKNNNNHIIDFVSYYKYELSVKNSDETLKCARMLLYTCLCEEITVLGSNTIRLIAKYDGDCDMFWSDNLNQSKDYILSSSLKPDEESDEEEYKKAYELKFSKYSSVKYINMFNYKTGLMYPQQVIFPEY